MSTPVLVVLIFLAPSVTVLFVLLVWLPVKDRLCDRWVRSHGVLGEVRELHPR